MKVSVFLIEDEGRESLGVHRRALKNLAFRSSSHEEEPVIRAEGDRGDRVTEVEMGNNYFLNHVDDQGEAIHVDADQHRARMVEH